jgi:hypothetical protein
LLVASSYFIETYVADVSNATGTASVTSADGKINIAAAFPFNSGPVGPTMDIWDKWEAVDLTRPIETITKSSEVASAEKSSAGSPVEWLHSLCRDRTINTYYTQSYLQAHFASPAAISIQIPAPGVDTTCAVAVSAAGSQGDANASAKTNSSVSGL